MTPGSILGLDLRGSTIYQYDAAGDLVDSLPVLFAPDSDPVSITVVDNQLFVFQQTGSQIVEVDAIGGGVTALFTTNVGREDLGRVGPI